jgi:hypothetical protein
MRNSNFTEDNEAIFEVGSYILRDAGKKVSFVIQGAIGEVKSGAFRGE